jgi:hypothetical protein
MLMRSRGEIPVPPGRGDCAVKSESYTAATGGKDAAGVVEGGGRKCGLTQYIVVSHKPEVFEQARCLVGVYSHKFTSLAVTVSFTARPRS